jgi:hypothetical protein
VFGVRQGTDKEWCIHTANTTISQMRSSVPALERFKDESP